MGGLPLMGIGPLLFLTPQTLVIHLQSWVAAFTLSLGLAVGYDTAGTRNAEKYYNEEVIH